MYEENNVIAFIIKHRIALLLAALVAIILIFLSRYGFVVIEVQNGSDQNAIRYVLSDQSSNKSSSFEATQTRYRKFMSKGSYTVSVSQNNKNFVGFVNTSGFLRTSKVQASLESEKARTFVGDNPENCMNYVDTRLLSYSCSGLYKTLRVHMPASTAQATYNLTAVESGETIAGTVQTKEGTVAMITPVSGDSSVGQLISLIGADGKISLSGKFHQELPARNNNQMLPHKDGFIVYDASLGYVNYYSSVGVTNPESITIEKPKDKKLSLYAAAGNQDTIAFAFANEDRAASKDHHTSKGLGSPSQIVVASGGKSKIVSIPMIAERIELCGTNKLCALSSGRAFVFDVAGKKAKELFSVPNSQAIYSTDNRLLVVTDAHVLTIDVDSKRGSVDYSLGDYKYCGVGKGKDNYVLCLINPLNRKVALAINSGQSDLDSIDKKVLDLQKSKAVSLVSIYDKNIFVLPNYGPVVYNPATKIYDNDPTTITRMNTTFKQDLAGVGINTSQYTVSGLRENY